MISTVSHVVKLTSLISVSVSEFLYFEAEMSIPPCLVHSILYFYHLLFVLSKNKESDARAFTQLIQYLHEAGKVKGCFNLT